MPRWNPSGTHWAAGVGGDGIALVVDNAVRDPGPNGSGDWITDTEIVTARGFGVNCDQLGPRIVAINAVTGTQRKLADCDMHALPLHVWAGGGRWGQLITGVGHRLDTGQPCDAIIGFGPDGSLATVLDTPSDTGLVYQGQILSRNLVADVHILGNGRIAWREADGPHTVGIPTPTLLPGQSYVLRCVFGPDHRWWVLYQASEWNGQLVLHPFDSFIGFALTTPGADAFGADVNAGLTTLWATKESEQLGQLALVSLSALTQRDLSVRAAPAPLPSPAPAPTPTPSPEPPSVSAPNLSPLLNTIAAKYNLADNSVANCAAIVHEFVEAAHAQNAEWGYISKMPGEMQYQSRSQDSVAFGRANPISVKLISGAGDPHPVTLVWVEGGPLRETDHWLYPDSATFGPQPTPTPAPTPAPSVDLTGLLASVAALETRLSALENKPQPAVDPTVAHKGDKVTVSEDFGFAHVVLHGAIDR